MRARGDDEGGHRGSQAGEDQRNRGYDVLRRCDGDERAGRQRDQGRGDRAATGAGAATAPPARPAVLAGAEDGHEQHEEGGVRHRLDRPHVERCRGCRRAAPSRSPRHGHGPGQPPREDGSRRPRRRRRAPRAPRRSGRGRARPATTATAVPTTTTAAWRHEPAGRAAGGCRQQLTAMPGRPGRARRMACSSPPVSSASPSQSSTATPRSAELDVERLALHPPRPQGERRVRSTSAAPARRSARRRPAARSRARASAGPPPAGRRRAAASAARRRPGAAAVRAAGGPGRSRTGPASRSTSSGRTDITASHTWKSCRGPAAGRQPAQRAAEGDQPDPVVRPQVGLREPGRGPHGEVEGWTAPGSPASTAGVEHEHEVERALRGVLPDEQVAVPGRRAPVDVTLPVAVARTAGPRRTPRRTRPRGSGARPAAPPARSGRRARARAAAPG